MINKQPYSNTKAKGPWQRKLAASLLAGLLAWLPSHDANAVISNTVIAKGNIGAIIVQDQATANVDVIDAVPNLSLKKIGILNDGGDGNADPGDFISYSFEIKNTGNVTLQNVTILDPSAVLTGAPIPALAPGAINTLAYTAKHILTSADVLAGTFTNTAVATAHASSGTDVTAGAFATTPLGFASAMTFSKSGALDIGTNGRVDANDHITYTFTVKNTGPSPIHNITISDPLVNLSSLPNPDRVMALLDASQEPSDPIATASIEPVSSSQYHFIPTAGNFNFASRSNYDPALVAANLNVVRQLVRMSPETTPLIAGDKIGFVYGLFNTGDAPLTSISVEQPNALAYGDALNILAPNAQDSASVIFTRNVTEAEIAAGEIIEPAKVIAHVRGQEFTQNVAAHLPLSSLKPYDSFATASITPTSFPTLNPGESTTFTAIYTLTQADVDAGTVHNSATATAKNQLDQTLTQVATFDQALLPVPSIALLKSGIVDLGPDNVASLGDVITYHFDVTNTGNVTLKTVNVTDLPGFTMSGGPIASLAPGTTNSTTFTATHSLVQADLDLGQITNQATATGKSPTNLTVTDLSDPADIAGDAQTIVSLAPKPAIALIKTVTSVNDLNGSGRNDAGDTITYGFSVKNTGNQTLTGVIVTDPKITIIGAPLASMAPGATDATHFTGTYLITLADMNVGHIDNTARVDGTAPGNVNVFDLSDPGVFTQDAPTVTPLNQLPQIGLVKTQTSITDTNNNSVTDTGDVIHYQFTVNNPGNVTLTNLNIIENLAGATVQGAPIASFVPTASDNSHFTAAYTITAADVLAGRVTNQATAKASSPNGSVVSSLSDNTDFTQHNPTITPITVIPSLAVIKTITGITDHAPANGLTDAGDIIQYRFTIKNTGTVPLTNVYVTDPNATVLGAHIANLPAGNSDSTTFTASHVLTPTDMINGNVTNQATGFGTAPSGAVVTDLSDNASFTADNPTVATFANAPKIALLKSVSSITDNGVIGVTDAGDVINYKLTLTNVGILPLLNITVTDNNGIVTGGPLASLGVLASDSTTFTASHVLTQADINAGSVTNQATAHSFTTLTSGEVADPSDPTSNTGNAPTITQIVQTPGLALLKTVDTIEDKNGNGLNDVNDIIHYKFTAVNTGNVPLTAVTLTDPNAVLSSNPAILPLLPAGATVVLSFTATHTITLTDANASQFANSASITGTPPVGANVSDTSDPSSLTGNAPTVTAVVLSLPVLTKTANISEVKRGMPVLYTITATNLGLGPYVLEDIMPPGFAYLASSATINSAAATPVITGSKLSFNNIMPSAGKITLKLKLLASTTIGGGKFVNNAHLIDPATSTVIATAQATVTIQNEAVFDCSDIIGRVFDDKNANGYMDDGEPGLPGVRVVTLNGLLITTDSNGLYHVPCAAVPDSSIGSNFLLKLDERTLPTGYKVTTENPRDVRVTRGKVVKLNFGASILREVRVDVTGKAFAANSTELTATWAKGINRLIAVLKKNRASLLIVYHRGGEAEVLAQARVNAIEDTVNSVWTSGHGAYRLVTTTRVEDGK
jgi:uncharacterized repeat protein (TIGR01451 family)